MKISEKHWRAMALLGLTTLTALTAVWTRAAIAGRKNAPPSEEAIMEETHEAQYCLPMEGSVIRGYSEILPVWSDTLMAFEAHDGLDIAGDGLVMAVAEGLVERAENTGRYGLTVAVRHEDGALTEYASLSDALVKVGERVRAGQVIGHGGKSAVCEQALGSHVHFCYYENGEIAAPPFTILPR